MTTLEKGGGRVRGRGGGGLSFLVVSRRCGGGGGKRVIRDRIRGRWNSSSVERTTRLERPGKVLDDSQKTKGREGGSKKEKVEIIRRVLSVK